MLFLGGRFLAGLEPSSVTSQRETGSMSLGSVGRASSKVQSCDCHSGCHMQQWKYSEMRVPGSVREYFAVTGSISLNASAIPNQGLKRSMLG